MRQKIRKRVALPLATAIVGAAALGALRFFGDRGTNPLSDDASIDADVVHVAPSVSGRILSIDVNENQLVSNATIANDQITRAQSTLQLATSTLS